MDWRAGEGSPEGESFCDGVSARERFERRVSWTPGAEGALGLGVVWVGWAFWGTMRRDCGWFIRDLP